MPQIPQSHLIRTFINSLPPDQQDNIQKIHDQLKTIVTQHGDDGALALGLLGAELSEE